MSVALVVADSGANRPERLTVASLGADPVALAERIDFACRALGWDNEQLGAAIGVGPDRAHEYRTGASRVGINRIPDLATALGRSPRWLLFGALEPDDEGESAPEFPRTPIEERAWRAAAKAADLAASVNRVADLARELDVIRASVPHGRLLALSLRRSARTIQRLDVLEPGPRR